MSFSLSHLPGVPRRWIGGYTDSSSPTAIRNFSKRTDYMSSCMHRTRVRSSMHAWQVQIFSLTYNNNYNASLAFQFYWWTLIRIIEV